MEMPCDHLSDNHLSWTLIQTRSHRSRPCLLRLSRPPRHIFNRSSVHHPQILPGRIHALGERHGESCCSSSVEEVLVGLRHRVGSIIRNYEFLLEGCRTSGKTTENCQPRLACDPRSTIRAKASGRLMTITDVNLAVAAGIVEAIDEISRFNSPQKLVSYFGLEPAGAAVGTGSRPSRSYQQDRPQSRARHAGRGGLGSAQGARSTACFSRGSAPGAPSDRCRGRQQDPRDTTSSRSSATEKVADVDQPTLTTSSRCATARC
jgi:hypothetical protein